MKWGDNDLYKPYPISQRELDGIYYRALRAFNDACDEIERQQDEAEIRRVIADCWGHRTYMLEVARG